MADVASAITTVQTCQAILSSLTALALTAYKFPEDATITNGSTHDFIVIGSGAGGSTVANRLSEDGNTTVALFECGGVPPLESVLPGIFTLQPNTAGDHNVSSTDDDYACQNLIDGIVQMTSGNMLGGSSCLDHMIYTRGSEFDYDKWAAVTGDDSWKLPNFMDYFKKSEKCLVNDILEAYSDYHGTSGPLGLTIQPSDYNTNIFAAFEEMGVPKIADITANVTLGICEPLMLIADTYRQSASQTYLGEAKNRSNLLVKMNTCVSKILFNSNNTAIGVETVDSSGNTMTIYAKKEVIVAAGTLKTPQVLVNSGIGPEDQLEALGITPIVNLPVGKNMSDHLGCVMVYTLDDGTAATVSNPHEFPVPMTTAYVALNQSQGYPDYQTINLFFPPSSAGLLQLCRWVFKYSDEICQTYYDANAEKNLLFVVHNLLHPVSVGEVIVNSTDISVNPIVKHGLCSNETDLINMAAYMQNFSSIVNTTYFKSVNSTFVNLSFSNCTSYDIADPDFWKCHALEMSSTMWHYSGTAALGRVLDTDLRVKNTTNVRVVCAAAMPYVIGGNIISAIYALAEKAADLIKADWSLS